MIARPAGCTRICQLCLEDPDALALARLRVHRDQTGDTLRDPAIRSLAERMADAIIARSVMQYFAPQAQDTAPGKAQPKPDRDTIVLPDISDSLDILF